MRPLILLFLTLSLVQHVSAQTAFLDTTFASHGVASIDVDSSSDTPTALALQPDGKLLVAGALDKAAITSDFTVVRLKNDGTLDSSFGKNGKVITDINNNSGDYAYCLALLPDGKFLVGGRTSGIGTKFDFAVVKYLSNGRVDSSFGIKGVAVVDFNQGNDIVYGLALLKDGRFLAAGQVNTGKDVDYGVVRFNANGTLDLSFGVGGKATIDIGNNDYCTDLRLQDDGKVVLAGYSLKGTTNFSLCRLDQTGKADATFGLGGRVMTDLGFEDMGHSLFIDASGRILVAGSSNSNCTIIRYTSGGVVDSAYATNGIMQAPQIAGSVVSLLQQADGKFILAGVHRNFSADFAALRVTASGVVDSTFGMDGAIYTDFARGYDMTTAAVLDAQQRIVLVGRISNDVNGYNFGLVRYTNKDVEQEIYTDYLSYPNGSCPGAEAQLTFHSARLFSPLNVFTAYVSDSTGSFAKPVFFGSVASRGFTYDAITGVLPLTQGSNYRLKLVSSDVDPYGQSYVGYCPYVFSVRCSPPAYGYRAEGVTATSALLIWDDIINCAIKFKVQYKPKGAKNWLTAKAPAGNSLGVVLSNLTPATTYVWRVAIQCKAEKGYQYSSYSIINKFTTLASTTSQLGAQAAKFPKSEALAVSPNPANSFITVSVNEASLQAVQVYDLQGRLVLTPPVQPGKTQRVDISRLSGGVYMVWVTTKTGAISKKFMKN